MLLTFISKKLYIRNTRKNVLNDNNNNNNNLYGSKYTDFGNRFQILVCILYMATVKLLTLLDKHRTGAKHIGDICLFLSTTIRSVFCCLQLKLTCESKDSIVSFQNMWL